MLMPMGRAICRLMCRSAPDTTIGLHHIYVVGSSSGDFSVQVFHVVAPGLTDPTISLQSTSIPVDGGVTVSGGGFTAGETVRIFLDNGALTVDTTASSSGSYGPITDSPDIALSGGSYILGRGIRRVELRASIRPRSAWRPTHRP